MTDSGQALIEIPPAELSATALRGLIEAHVLREGTEYGAREWTLDEKVGHVLQRLARGEARILYDPATRNVEIVPAAPSPPRVGDK